MSLWTTCYMPNCENELDEWATLPVCNKCSWRIAQWHKERIIAEDANARLTSLAGKRERAAVTRGDREGSVVYYALIGDHVKIGYTTRLRSRLAALRVDPSELLAVEPGGSTLERQRHLEFAADRIDRRENFRMSAALLGHIEQVRHEHRLPHWATIPSGVVTLRRQDT